MQWQLVGLNQLSAPARGWCRVMQQCCTHPAPSLWRAIGNQHLLPTEMLAAASSMGTPSQLWTDSTAATNVQSCSAYNVQVRVCSHLTRSCLAAQLLLVRCTLQHAVATAAQQFCPSDCATLLFSSCTAAADQWADFELLPDLLLFSLVSIKGL